MKIEELLQGIEVCSCGRAHRCPIDHVVVKEGACRELGDITSDYQSILLVADRNTYAVGGEACEEALVGRIEDRLIYDSGESVLIPNEEAISLLEDRVTDRVDLIVGIGSGVINDLCKYVSHKKGLSYMIVATAPSMDGYASKGAALILGGMKVTLTAEVPKAIIGDVDLLKEAPLSMLQAGYGDVIGKYSCLSDWRLSQVVGGEYLCETVWEATKAAAEETVLLADALLRREPKAVKALMEALVAVGILMAYVGNSRPASGSEHHLSHYFEIVGILRGEPYFDHGVDVCYSAIETAKLRERLLTLSEIPSDFVSEWDPVHYEREIRRIYGSAADEVIALQEKQGWYRTDRITRYREAWQTIREVLSDAPSVARMQELTERIGLSEAEFRSVYGEEKLADARLYAKDLKDRYTVLWMYYDLLPLLN